MTIPPRSRAAHIVRHCDSGFGSDCALLLQHLQQHKSYPDRARRRREQGVVLLAFTIDRNGHVLARHIVQGSGYADLDAEVLELVARAQPLPAFPPSMTGAQLDLTVPVRFSLR